MPQHFWTGLLWTGRSEYTVVAETTDGGASWKQYPFAAKNRGVWVLKYDTTSKVLLASSSDGIFALQTNADVRNFSAPDHSVFLTSDASNTNTTIHFPSSPITQLQLFDILGREIYSTTMLNASSFDLRNSDFKSGSYIIKISNKSGVVGIAKWICHGE